METMRTGWRYTSGSDIPTIYMYPPRSKDGCGGKTMSGEVGRRVLGKCSIGLTLGSERSRDLKMMNPYSHPSLFFSSSFFFLFSLLPLRRWWQYGLIKGVVACSRALHKVVLDVEYGFYMAPSYFFPLVILSFLFLYCQVWKSYSWSSMMIQIIHR